MEPNKLKNPGNPYDINGQHFNSDMYLQKLFREHSLKEIMEQEENIVRDTQKLHSEMQTLVYENYNKFISATDTIRKMKTDFKQMETEMDLLGKNMDSITSFSDQISHTLLDTRQQISKLSGIHSLLKRLQFLFKLPNKLKSLMEEGNYRQAVEDYMHTQQVLNHYAHLESFKGIQSDCLAIVEILKEKLHSKFDSKTASAKEVAESVEMLLMLNETAESLYLKYLSHGSSRLDGHLECLKNSNPNQDLIELVDLAISGFLSDLRLIVTSYKQMFLSGNNSWELGGQAELDDWLSSKMNSFLLFIRARSDEESSIAVLVRALDRLYNSLATAISLFSCDFTIQVVEIAMECGKRECERRRKELSEKLADSLRDARQSLTDQPNRAQELLNSIIDETVKAVKLHINELSDLRGRKLPLTKEEKLQESIEISLRQILLEGFLDDLLKLAHSFTSKTVSLPALLVLAKMCLEFSNTYIHDLLNLVDGAGGPEEERLSKEILSVAQELGNHYVKVQGNIIGQMIRKSVETRDWAHCLEPKRISPVMKRILEELSSAEPVASLFEDNQVPPPGSGSRYHARSSTGLSWADQSYTHNFHKLFSDKIEIFTPIEFTKTSILTGIIKISLKTHLECVRLKTFNQFGLQQIQVDIHYLHGHLWKYVPDENLMNTLLEEILQSAKKRCTDPVFFHPKIVENLCEKDLRGKRMD